MNATTVISPSPQTPDPQTVDLASPLRWLAAGWADLRRNPVPGLVHGCLLALFGWILLAVGHNHFWLLAGAFSGFLIVAPIVATGLYHVSRECYRGRCVGMREVIGLWRSGDGRLMRFGALLALAGTGWVLTSAGLITLMSDAPIQKPVDFVRHVLLNPRVGLFEVWVLMGGLLAAPIFASSVVAIPMLVDTSMPVTVAVSQSWRAVADYPLPMVAWALTIAVLMGIGMATGLIALIVLVPLVAHASWHAYCDLTSRPHGGHESWPSR